MNKKPIRIIILSLLFFIQTMVSYEKNGTPNTIIINTDVIFKNKRWQKQREAVVFLLKHQAEFPMLLRIAIVLIYKKFRKQKLSVPLVLKEFRELQKYKDEIYNFIALENPCDEVVDLLKQLKDCGIRLVFATTMMKESVEYNKTLFQDIFSLFDTVLEQVPSKIDKNFCDQLCHIINQQGGMFAHEKIIYLDTKRDVIEMINNAGLSLQGILFSEPGQLENDLKEIMPF